MRSALHDWHLANGAAFKRFAGRDHVAQYGSRADEGDGLQQLGMVDLSLWPRCGYRGPGAAGWLGRTMPLPRQVNGVQKTEAGDIVLRPADTEYWLVADLVTQEQRKPPFSAQVPDRPEPGVYDMWCGHARALIALGGRHATDCMSKLCALDVRPDRFRPESMAQTLIGGVTATLLRWDFPGMPVYLVFCEASLARYMWESLLHAGREFGGSAVGLAALRAALQRPPRAAPDGSGP